MATESSIGVASRKRSIAVDSSEKKKKKRKRVHEEDEDLDVSVGLNRAIGRMDSQLLADHMAQKTARFGTELSSVELSDLYTSGNALGVFSQFSC
jgi:protein CMS1